MKEFNKWLATRPVVALLVSAAVAAAVSRGLVPAEVGQCLDLLLGAQAEAL